MMRRLSGWATALVLVAVCGGCGGSTAITPAPEVPQLRIGMSVGEAKRDLGPRFKLPYWEAQGNPECNSFEIEGTQIRGMVFAKQVATVTFDLAYDARGNADPRSAAVGLRGLRPGQPLQRAVKLFGHPNRIAAAEGNAAALLFWRLGEADGRKVFLRASTYEQAGLEKGAIASLEVGVAPQIFYVEGCA
jgi:hypothetical protein